MKILTLWLLVISLAFGMLAGCNHKDDNPDTDGTQSADHLDDSGTTESTAESSIEEKTSDIQIEADFDVERICYILNESQSEIMTVSNFVMNGHYDFDDARFEGNINITEYPITKESKDVVFYGAIGLNCLTISNMSQDPFNPSGDTVYDVWISLKDRENILIFITHEHETYAAICAESASEAWENYDRFIELQK